MENGYDVHHRDGNPKNNVLANLDYLTHKAHMQIHCCKPTEMLKSTLTFSIPHSLLTRLEEAKWRFKMTRSKLVQEAVKEYLEKKDTTK